MSKTENFLSGVKRRKLFDEQYKDSTMVQLAKESLYLQQQQATSQFKMQKDIRLMLIIMIIMISFNVLGYLWMLFFGDRYWTF